MFDTGIFIYPVATSAVPFGYRCYATKSTYNLALTDTPILDENWQQVLVLGLRKYIYTQRGLLTEASAADADYEKEISKMVDIIGDLQNYPFFRETPDLIQYQ